MNKPTRPVMPSGLEFVIYYTCPNCGAMNGAFSPVEPGMLTCGHCQTEFPVIPVDARSLQYIRLMTGNGRFMVESDFL